MVLLVMFCRSGNSGLQADPVLSGVSGCCQNRAGTYRIKTERWAQELTWWSCFSAIEADDDGDDGGDDDDDDADADNDD